MIVICLAISALLAAVAFVVMRRYGILFGQSSALPWEKKLDMKRTVSSYSVQVIGTDLYVDIATDRNRRHCYRIVPDLQHPDLFEISKHLNAGLSEAQRFGVKIDVTECFELSYVFIRTPIPYHCDQYSAAERH